MRRAVWCSKPRRASRGCAVPGSPRASASSPPTDLAAHATLSVLSPQPRTGDPDGDAVLSRPRLRLGGGLYRRSCRPTATGWTSAPGSRWPTAMASASRRPRPGGRRPASTARAARSSRSMPADRSWRSCWPRGSTSDIAVLLQLDRASALGGEFARRLLPRWRHWRSRQPLRDIAVTAQRVEQEQLGDLKLYRVPDRTTVARAASRSRCGCSIAWPFRSPRFIAPISLGATVARRRYPCIGAGIPTAAHQERHGASSGTSVAFGACRRVREFAIAKPCSCTNPGCAISRSTRRWRSIWAKVPMCAVR